jgi:3-hydroxyisobutyrate dehydrogenase-like beta-hydroxyacid dehydrogenase
MTKLKIGFLHPGDMGISLAAAAQNSGHAACWVSEGRSRETRARAEKFSLLDAHSLNELCENCSVIVSICPPEAAEEVANKVLGCSFRGIYLDANAKSPQRAVRIGEAMSKAGATFIDGGIIGGPAWERGTTWLYLSGKEAQRAADCFSAGPLETCIIADSIGKASALKMCYAAYTKGTRALLYALLAAAEEFGVRRELEEHWRQEESTHNEEAQAGTKSIRGKAWRYVAEMEEIAATFREANIPGEFHMAAAEIYRRGAHFKHAPEPPSLEAVLEALLRPQKSRAA